MRSRKETNHTVVVTVVVIISCLVASYDGELSSVNQSHVKCFEDYMMARADIMAQYESSYVFCNKDVLPERQRVANINIEEEKENLANASEVICVTLEACNKIHDPQRNLECYSKTASDNFFKSVEMHLNASAIVIELNEDIEEADRDIMRCNFQAKQRFIMDSFEAFQQFIDCLDDK